MEILKELVLNQFYFENRFNLINITLSNAINMDEDNFYMDYDEMLKYETDK